jgi:hypothetical protein
VPESSESDGGGMFGGFSMPGAGMLAGAGQTMTAMSVLDAATKVKINPLQIRKAGAIIQNMQGVFCFRIIRVSTDCSVPHVTTHVRPGVLTQQSFMFQNNISTSTQSCALV